MKIIELVECLIIILGMLAAFIMGVAFLDALIFGNNLLLEILY